LVSYKKFTITQETFINPYLFASGTESDQMINQLSLYEQIGLIESQPYLNISLDESLPQEYAASVEQILEDAGEKIEEAKEAKIIELLQNDEDRLIHLSIKNPGQQIIANKAKIVRDELIKTLEIRLNSGFKVKYFHPTQLTGNGVESIEHVLDPRDYLIAAKIVPPKLVKLLTMNEALTHESTRWWMIGLNTGIGMALSNGAAYLSHAPQEAVMIASVMGGLIGFVASFISSAAFYDPPTVQKIIADPLETFVEDAKKLDAIIANYVSQGKLVYNHRGG
jgi:hypothetical protein